jgi:hypothetical protein
VEVTSGEVGAAQLLVRLIREHAGSTGRTVTEVVADTKYGTHAHSVARAAAPIRARIPPFPGGGIRRVRGRKQVVYDPATDRSRCPAGQPLRRMGRTRTGTPRGRLQYRAAPHTCRAFPRNAACCGTAAARTITRPDDAGLSERVRASLATRHARRSVRRRGCWVETVHAALEERHGRRRAQCRGRATVQIQAYGAASAYNVKKLVAGRSPQPVQATAALSPRPRPRVPAVCSAPRSRSMSTSPHFGNRPRRGQ